VLRQDNDSLGSDAEKRDSLHMHLTWYEAIKNSISSQPSLMESVVNTGWMLYMLDNRRNCTAQLLVVFVQIVNLNHGMAKAWAYGLPLPTLTNEI
jgi:hypothetical protein